MHSISYVMLSSQTWNKSIYTYLLRFVIIFGVKVPNLIEGSKGGVSILTQVWSFNSQESRTSISIGKFVWSF